MRHFTREWWASGSPEAEAVFARYAEHFAKIRASLPPQLTELEEKHTLHDAEVKQIACDFGNRSVTMCLHGWDQDLQKRVRYVLEFLDALHFEQVLPQQEYVEEEFGNLGYWECELVSAGIQVNMLFVSGAEFRIVFNAFKLQAHAQ